MLTDNPWTLLWIALAFALAGLVKGVVGMGLPTVAIGMLGVVMAPVTAAALLVIPSFVTNVWQMVTGGAITPLLRRLATMMIAVVVGTLLGIGVLTGSSTALASICLGAVLVLYGFVGLRGQRFVVARRSERWWSPLIGLATGLVTGATGVFVVPAVPYLNSLGLSKDELIQALGLAFTVSTIALAVALYRSGRFELEVASQSTLAVLPALAGMFVGQRLRQRLSAEAFRRWFFIGLIALGVYMLLRVLLIGVNQ